ncbi:unnamed protein product, partial [Laminaria digitata]
HAAVSSGRPLVLLYILDEQTKGLRPLGGASKWWLDKSLRALAADIKQAGAQLTLRSGQSADVLDTVIEETGAETISGIAAMTSPNAIWMPQSRKTWPSGAWMSPATMRGC